jgi:hypothetical protein
MVYASAAVTQCIVLSLKKPLACRNKSETKPKISGNLFDIQKKAGDTLCGHRRLCWRLSAQRQ